MPVSSAPTLAAAPAAPQLPPAFVTAGRAAVAGLLGLAYLGWRRTPLPALAVCALGTVLGFPQLLALARRHVDAMHAAVVTGVLPLAAGWAGFGHVSLFSMGLGFFAGYRGLALLMAVPILGERLDAATVGLALAVLAVVLVGRRLPAGAAR